MRCDLSHVRFIFDIVLAILVGVLFIGWLLSEVK